MLITGSDTKVVELRAHGVSGTRPETLVDAAVAVDVGGDGVGRVVRPADRLRRPAPGPVLVAGGRPIPRVVEGYVWGGMTSGGFAKATWALLLPFALSNVAHWMLPPVAADRPLDRSLGLLARSVLRAVSLLLTCLLVAQVTLLTADLVAAQCLAPGSACLGFVPEWARSAPAVRALVAVVPIALLAWLLHAVSSTEWTAPEEPAGVEPVLPATPLAGDPDTPTLRSLHTIAGLATATLLVAGGPGGPVSGALAAPWWLALALLAIAGAGVVLLDDPTGSSLDRGGDWVRRALTVWPRRLLIAEAAVTLLSVAVVAGAVLPGSPTPPDGMGLAGSGPTIEAIAALLAVLVAMLAIVLVPAARLARGAWATLPRELRPWAGGWAAAPIAALSVLVGAGFGAGIALTARRVLGREDLTLPEGYAAVALVWGGGGAVLAVAALGLALVLLVRWRRAPVPPEVALLQGPSSAEVAAPAWRRAAFLRRHVHHAVFVAVGVLVALTALAWAADRSGESLDVLVPLRAFGVTVLAALAGAVRTAVYRAARQPDEGRRLGVLWDLASFWPREAHPAVPPCYALKVVPELVARAREHLTEPGTRVVLVGDSQGSLLATVATARLVAELPDADRERVGLVTTGSQLQWAYARAFPAVVPLACLARLAGSLDGRWRSLCRGTDPVGGAVTTWRRQVVDGALLGVGLRPDGEAGPLPAASRSPHGALVLGGDHWLPDPAVGPTAGRRWRAGVLGHDDYLADPEWDDAIALAAGLPAGHGAFGGSFAAGGPETDPPS